MGPLPVDPRPNLLSNRARIVVASMVMVAVLVVGSAAYILGRTAPSAKFCAVSVDGDQFSTGTQGPCPDVERWEQEHGYGG